MATYVMCVRDTGYWLVGPFGPEPHGASVNCDDHRFQTFLDNGPANPLDDPRWQSIDLDDPGAAPRVFTLAEHVEFVRNDRSPEMPILEGFHAGPVDDAAIGRAVRKGTLNLEFPTLYVKLLDALRGAELSGG